MEALSESLQPYKETIGQVASIVTIAQFFSGVFICKDIYNQKSTKGVSAVPFIGGIVVGVVLLQYALVLADNAMFQVNVAAIFLNLIYLLVYIHFSENKEEEVWKPLRISLAITVAILSYGFVENEENLEFRYGILTSIMQIVLTAAPLAEMKQMIIEKDASSIPFPIAVGGAVTTMLWMVYSIILMNYFMLIQNAVTCTLLLIQLILYYMYPARTTTGNNP